MMRSKKSPFKGRLFTAEVILWAVRWYLQVPISHRDLERRLADRSVAVDHTTLFRWIQAYAPELDRRLRPHLRTTTGSRPVVETLCRGEGAMDGPVPRRRCARADVLLSAKRDAAAVRRVFSKALKQAHTAEPPHG